MTPTTDIAKWLIQQTPTIVVLGIVCAAMYRYFVKKEEATAKIIALKDAQIDKQNTDQREDLHRSHGILLDLNGVMKEWILKNDQTTDLNRGLKTTIDHIKVTTDRIENRIQELK